MSEMKGFLNFDNNNPSIKNVDKIIEGISNNNIPNKIKQTTYVVLLKFISSTIKIYDNDENIIDSSDDELSMIDMVNDNRLLKILSSKSFIFVEGSEELNKIISLIISSCKMIDLENSYIISDNNSITESLSKGNNLLKFIRARFQNPEDTIERYISEQEVYNREIRTEYDNYSEEYDILLNIINDLDIENEEDEVNEVH